jgi:DNA-binding CsgD family transcriptional regulator
MAELPIDNPRVAQAPLSVLRDILELPADAALFYAFGGSLEHAEAEAQQPLQAKVLCETHAMEWWRDYRRHASDRAVDPIRNAIRRGNEPVHWRNYEKRADMSATERAMWRRVRDIGLRDGITVPLRDPRTRRYGVLNVMHFGPLAEFDDWLRAHQATLGPAAYLAHLAISNALPLPGETGCLSERERQCLSFVAQGFSSKRISRQIDLSPRTVELHVARAVRRLGAVNRSHAVALALRRKMLEF